MWSPEEESRAPIGDFPPPWASAWGDDSYGLWADLTVNGATQRMRWIEPSGPEGFWIEPMEKESTTIRDENIHFWAKQHEHEPIREVVRYGFWLADTPCTQAFWTAVVGENSSYFREVVDASERPMENVSFDTVMRKFAAYFAAMPDHAKVRLPTWVEWKYAARAGTRTAYWWGDAWDSTKGNADVANKRGSGDPEGTTAVHRYRPNPWGLYDMHGNVWEWCADLWRPHYESWPRMEDAHLVCGGSWFTPPAFARITYSEWRPVKTANRTLGFRFILITPRGREGRSNGADRWA